jgi:hypothetical protein
VMESDTHVLQEILLTQPLPPLSLERLIEALRQIETLILTWCVETISYDLAKRGYSMVLRRKDGKMFYRVDNEQDWQQFVSSMW